MGFESYERIVPNSYWSTDDGEWYQKLWMIMKIAVEAIPSLQPATTDRCIDFEKVFVCDY